MQSAERKNNLGRAALGVLAVATLGVGWNGNKRAETNPACATESNVASRAWCGLNIDLPFGGNEEQVAAPAPSAPTPVQPEVDNACPLNGAIYDATQQSQWQQRRPMGVVIENSTQARPQSGIANADNVYEMVAEGGITRFLAVYYCQNAPFVGPVRSARQGTLDMVMGYGDNPLYVHAGGAESANENLNAFGRIAGYGWDGYNDIDALEGGPFERQPNRLPGVDTEHTLYASTSALWNHAASLGLASTESRTGEPWTNGFRPYSYKADAPAEQRPSSQHIDIPFWGDNNYTVGWSYDPTSNSYQRSNGGEIHIDLNNSTSVTAHNVVVLFMNEARLADGSHTQQETVGSNTAYIFMDGQFIRGTWQRSETSQPILEDSNGQEISFNRGQIWYEMVATGTSVSVN